MIEAVRLAEALATLRGRPLAGLAEVTEATRAVLCDGDELRVELVNRKLVIGERLGEIPPDTPGVPLAADLAASQKSLRLAPSALSKDHDLDLRRDDIRVEPQHFAERRGGGLRVVQRRLDQAEQVLRARRLRVRSDGKPSLTLPSNSGSPQGPLVS